MGRLGVLVTPLGKGYTVLLAVRVGEMAFLAAQGVPHPGKSLPFEVRDTLNRMRNRLTFAPDVETKLVAAWKPLTSFLDGCGEPGLSFVLHLPLLSRQTCPR